MDSDILKILNEELIELRRMTKLAQDRLDLQREDLNETKRKSEEFRKWMLEENKAREKRMTEHEKWMKDHELRMQHSEENQKFMKQGLEILLSKIQSIDEKVDRGLGGTSSH